MLKEKEKLTLVLVCLKMDVVALKKGAMCKQCDLSFASDWFSCLSSSDYCDPFTIVAL
jgi:hypothetical protein